MASIQQPETQQIREASDGLAAAGLVPEVKIYSHSGLFYWWPVWVTGYVMALLTYLNGQTVTIGGQEFLFHPSKNLGVIYTMVFTLVILFTNISLRGMASAMVIVLLAFVTVLFAWLGWWDNILRLLPYLGMHMNMGFFLFFSSAIFTIWALAFFVFDRLHYWRIRPGQMTYERVIGGGERSYDTRGMVFEKRLEDLFKHVLLGLGTGDLHVATSGARSEELVIPNVVFVDRKVRQIQRLIAIKPEETPQRAVTVGSPE